jgi:Tfp pilus assembly protein PilO
MGALAVATIFTVGALLPDLRTARGATQETSTLQHAIDEQSLRLQGLADQQREADEIRAKLVDFDTALPQSQRIGAFLEALDQIAREVGVTGKNVRPGEPIAAANVDCLPIDVDVTGSFAAVFEFVRRVEALPRIARVQRLELERGAVARNGGRLSALIMANLRASPGKSAVLGIGVIVLAVLLVRLVVSGPKSADAEPTVAVVPQPAGKANAANATNAAKDASAQPVVRPRLSRPHVRQTLARDPFAFDWMGSLATRAELDAEKEDASDDKLTLQMILTGDAMDGARMAVISGTMVYPGSQIEGYEVSEISRDFVTLRNRTEEIQLRLP